MRRSDRGVERQGDARRQGGSDGARLGRLGATTLKLF